MKTYYTTDIECIEELVIKGNKIELRARPVLVDNVYILYTNTRNVNGNPEYNLTSESKEDLIAFAKSLGFEDVEEFITEEVDNEEPVEFIVVAK